MHCPVSAADRLRGAAGAVALTVIVGAAAADQLAVPQSYPTIQAAVDAAAPGDEVIVAPGTYARFSVAGKAVAVRGAGPDLAFIDAQGSGPAVELTAEPGQPGATVSGFTVRNGASENGAGLYLAGAVTAENLVVAFNAATNGAGAFAAGAPTFRNVRFEDNTAVNGGAVFVAQDAMPTFTSCTFERNNAEFGGAAHVSPRGFNDTRADFTDCAFEANAADRGGAIALYNATVTVTGGECSANVAASTGGAVDADAFSNADLTGVVITANDAGDGAAVYTAGGSVASITDAQVHANTSAAGAAMHAADGEIVFGDSRLYANTPADTAGTTTDVGGNVFHAPPCSDADIAEPFGEHTVNDVLEFINGFNNRTPIADVSPTDGIWDVNDIVHFVNEYVYACR